MSNQHTAGWTKKDLKLVRDVSKTHAEVARALGRTEESVECKRRRMGVKFNFAALRPVAVVPNHEVDKVVADNHYWEGKYRVLNSEYQKSLKEGVLVDRLIADIKALAPVSYSPLAGSLPVLRTKGRKQTPESAVLLLSDTHIGKVTKLSQTLGFSEYNFPTFLARLKFLETSVLSILEDHTTSPLDELVIPMLGDMLDGALAHGSEVGQKNTVFDQWYAGGHALALFLRNLASRVPKIRIVTCVGNHTRWGTQHKMPTENRYSNFDSLLYHYIAALTKDIPNIEWTLDEQPFAVFKIQGWTFFASHGDNLKGGDKAFGIPAHAMARQMNANTLLFHKHGEEVPHYYVLGHFHRPIQLPTGLGDFTVNGGFPGADGYSLTGNFSPVDASQTFFRLHPTYGKVAEYKIQLKFAKIGDKPAYDVPGKFHCV